ncbi:P-type conjugative transfer protein VirB9 [Stenoxybacter acetivorans]|uniref:P-type conjugative transfer protein VirB9 n=1 Tax=Stenoxybacter acetivorans TaxID=422441 RepID=UPI00068B4A2C|nr:P-type conjugative transfer protein VirB9 [Stenoxybacter acetivorans]
MKQWSVFLAARIFRQPAVVIKATTAAIIAAFCLPVVAETLPQSAGKDSRVQVVEYHPDQVYRIRGKIGSASMVQLEAGETVSGDNALLGMGDAEAWKVAVQGNNIIFKPTVSRPETNLIIQSNKRTYVFALSLLGKTKQAPTYLLRFAYPDSVQAARNQEAERTAKAIETLTNNGANNPTYQYAVMRNLDYWAYGDKSLAPTSAWDNGRFTYFRFDNAKDLPTVYRVLPDGTEVLVNVHIDKDTVVVHEIAAQFILRLGKSVLALENRNYHSGEFNRTGTADSSTVRIVK